MGTALFGSTTMDKRQLMSLSKTVILLSLGTHSFREIKPSATRVQEKQLLTHNQRPDQMYLTGYVLTVPWQYQLQARHTVSRLQMAATTLRRGHR